jgi:hypothetical protein
MRGVDRQRCDGVIARHGFGQAPKHAARLRSMRHVRLDLGPSH